MKLILSSCDFLNEKSKKRILNNIDKSIEKVRVLFIPNKLFNIDDLDKYYQRLAIDGFTKKENIFIFNEKDSRSFNNLDIDLIYIGGGNTFFTLKKLKDSEFDKEIIKYIKNDEKSYDMKLFSFILQIILLCNDFYDAETLKPVNYKMPDMILNTMRFISENYNQKLSMKKLHVCYIVL